jgi:hypothetical protein
MLTNNEDVSHVALVRLLPTHYFFPGIFRGVQIVSANSLARSSAWVVNHAATANSPKFNKSVPIQFVITKLLFQISKQSNTGRERNFVLTFEIDISMIFAPRTSASLIASASSKPSARKDGKQQRMLCPTGISLLRTPNLMTLLLTRYWTDKDGHGLCLLTRLAASATLASRLIPHL